MNLSDKIKSLRLVPFFRWGGPIPLVKRDNQESARIHGNAKERFFSSSLGCNDFGFISFSFLIAKTLSDILIYARSFLSLSYENSY